MRNPEFELVLSNVNSIIIFPLLGFNTEGSARLLSYSTWLPIFILMVLLLESALVVIKTFRLTSPLSDTESAGINISLRVFSLVFAIVDSFDTKFSLSIVFFFNKSASDSAFTFTTFDKFSKLLSNSFIENLVLGSSPC